MKNVVNRASTGAKKNFNLFNRFNQVGKNVYDALPLRYLCATLLLLTLGVGQMWAWDWADGRKIYFNMEHCTDFGTPYFRIGHDTWNNAYEMSLVDGTKYLYEYTKSGAWGGYGAFSVANNQAWTNGNSIYQSNHGITKQTDYQKYAASSDVYLKITSTANFDDECQYYHVNGVTSGDGSLATLPTYTVSYSTTGTGSGTLTVTKYNGSTYDAFSSGSSVNPTQIMKVTTSPNSGSSLANLAVSGAIVDPDGDGSTYYVTGNTTITATFNLEETHDVTIYYKCSGSEIGTGHYTESNVGVSTTRSVTAPAIEGYIFSSWSLGNGLTNHSANTSANPIVITTDGDGSTYTLTANYTAKTLVTLYYSNPAGWSNVYAYVWKDGGTANASWHGVDITSNTVERNCTTYYYYSYYKEDASHSTWNKVIFNDGGSNQTGDISFSNTTNNGQYNNANAGASGSWAALPAAQTAYTVTVATENVNKGTVSPSSGTATASSCHALAIEASPTTYYLFDHWTPGANISVASTSNASTTATATANGTVTAYFKDKWCLIGGDSDNAANGADDLGNWSLEANPLSYVSGTTVQGTVTFTTTGTYYIKVVDRTTPTYYGKNSTTIDRAHPSAASDLSSSGNNITLIIDVAGTYTFAYDVAGADLVVTYPAAYAVNFSVSTIGSGTGGSISADISSGDLVLNGSSVTLTASAANSGYIWKGWYSVEDPSADYTSNKDEANAAYTFTVSGAKTTYAVYAETTYSVTVDKNLDGGTISTESLTAGPATESAEVTATPYVGYKFTGWTIPGTVTVTEGTASSNTIKVNATAASTITANFVRTYAFIEGRFHVNNSSLDSWTNTFSGGNWDDASIRIPFLYDGTNHRFYLHTYAKPSELTSQISSQNPVFYIKTSTASGSLTDVVSYKAENADTYVTDAGTANKVALYHHDGSSNTNDANLRFNSDDESGYVILYFDQSDIWFEFEQTLEYNGNGSDGGSAPASRTFHDKGSNATAASNSYTRTNYQFTGWNTQADGNGTAYAAGATDVAMNSNITLYAQWEPIPYTVTVNDGDHGTVDPHGSVETNNVSGVSITAEPAEGYVFASWTTTGAASVNSSTANPAILKASAAGGTVTATYRVAKVIYFKDVLGWNDVYAYIFSNNSMHDSNGVQPTVNKEASGHMTLFDATNNVWKFEFDTEFTAAYIAFSKDNKLDAAYFNSTQGVYRADYSTTYPMYVPGITVTYTKNSTPYYNEGKWFPYSNHKNYNLNYGGTPYELVFEAPGSLVAHLASPLNLPADYTAYTISVSDGSNTYGSSTNLDHAAYLAGTQAALVADPASLTVTTLAKGNHNFTLSFTNTVAPQLALTTVPAAYIVTFGAGNGGDATTAKRGADPGIAITSGDYIAPGTRLTFNQTPHEGSTFVKWNTERNGTGTDLGNSPVLVTTMPSEALSVYPLYMGELETDWLLAGEFNNWTGQAMHQKSVGSVGIVYKDVELAAGKQYRFKIADSAPDPDVWYGNDGTMTQAYCTDWDFTSGGGDCYLVTTIAGTYHFVFNTSTKKLSVIYPDNAKQATMYDSPVRDANGDVMLQAYYWMDNHDGTVRTDFGDARWANLATEADTIGKYFNLVWLPPSQATADRIGFLPTNYSVQGNDSYLGTSNLLWGTGAQLRTLIDGLHNAGAKVIADIVLNHSTAASQPDEITKDLPQAEQNWCEWETFNFGRYGSFAPDWSWITSDDEMFVDFWRENAHIKRDMTGECGTHYDDASLEGDEKDHSYGTDGTIHVWSNEQEWNCSYSRDWAHKKQVVREMSRAYLTWMRDSIGYDGWRYDFMKGFHGSHLYDYNRASGPYFSVAEVFDGDINNQTGVLKDANYSTYMFDFPGKNSIYNVAIRGYRLENLRGNFNTLLADHRKYAVTFIDNHDTFHEGSNMYGTANTIDDRQAHQALAYLLSMPGVPCILYPYWNNYKEICKKLIYARKAAGVNSESYIDDEWADGTDSDRNNNTYYNARIAGSKGYLFLKIGKKSAPLTSPGTAPGGKTYILAWGNDEAAVWYTTNDTEPLKFRLLVTCNGETFYSNEVTHPGDTLSYYATTDAKYQWQKYELFEWHNIGATTPAAVSANNVYMATFDSVHVAVANVQPYAGDYYIRTATASGGLDDYMVSGKDNKFTYFSNVSVATGDPYHYYWVKNIAKNNVTVSVKAQVANRFNGTITNVLGKDGYTNDTCGVQGNVNGINIRFSYEPSTNKLGRAMILGSTENDYLNIIGSNIYGDRDCTVAYDEARYASTPADSKLGDVSDWVYEKSVYVKIDASTPESNVIVKSMFKTTPSSEKKVQYMLGYQKDFYGEETSEPVAFPVLATGTSEGTYSIRIIYDYKTNRLTGTWEPTDMEVDGDLSIGADVLFVRDENNNTAQIRMKTESDSVKSLKHVIFVLEMRNDTLPSVENHYWISLPFDCQICNIYGLEGYMTNWGIQEYDGKTRAEKGWYKLDTETFWRWMSPNETLKAGVGYVVHVDKTVLDWQKIGVGVEKCVKKIDGITDSCYTDTIQKAVKRLYFPSDSAGFKLSKTGSDQSITYEDWTCLKPNRKAQDSNWRLISAANYNNTAINAFERQYNDSVLDKAPDFIYAYKGDGYASGKRFEAVDAKTAFTYKSFNSYMAQFSGTINWAQFTQSTPQNVAARRYASGDNIERANMYFEMVDANNVQQDFTYIYLRENATYGFDHNRDLTKIVYEKANQVYSVNYSDVDTVPYVANVLPTESQRVRLTVNVNKAGTYTFRMPKGTDGVGAVLVDSQLGQETDLNLWSYTVDLPKGNFTDRFYINIDVHKTPTIIDITNPDELDENGNVIRTVKFMRDGLLYLQRGDKTYDVTGKEIK